MVIGKKMNIQQIFDFASKFFTKEIISQSEIMSVHLPISLLSLAGSSGYLYFDILPDTYPADATTVTLEVSTSRGKAKRMKLSVPKNG